MMRKIRTQAQIRPGLMTNRKPIYVFANDALKMAPIKTDASCITYPPQVGDVCKCLSTWNECGVIVGNYRWFA